MKRKIICALLAVLFCAAPAAANTEERVLSMQPSAPPEKLAAMLAPLAEKLSAALGGPVRSLLLNNSAAYETELLGGGITFGYQDTLLYVKISDRHEVLAAAQSRNGGQLRGLIISRPQAGISRPEDLKDRTVLIAGRDSAGGYLSQKQSLREAGLDVEKDCRLIQAAGGREENVIIAVSLGDADAGFITESALRSTDSFIIPGSVTEVMKTAPLPGWALSASRSLPQELKERLQAALTQLPENDPALAALGISGFKAAQDADYDPVRRLAE
jgi:phosphonate transport system substrate-binding protein